jgi:Domain of unknown function (DUF4355)
MENNTSKAATAETTKTDVDSANQKAETVTTTSQNVDNKTKTFTQEELDTILSKRLSEDREKQKEETKKAIEEEKRLAKLSAEDREKELLSKAAKDLEARERALTLKTNELSAIRKLEEYKIPTKFVDLFLGEDEATMYAKIDSFKDEYAKAVEAGVEARLSSGTSSNKDVNTGVNQGSSKPIHLTTTF